MNVRIRAKADKAALAARLVLVGKGVAAERAAKEQEADLEALVDLAGAGSEELAGSAVVEAVLVELPAAQVAAGLVEPVELVVEPVLLAAVVKVEAALPEADSARRLSLP